MKASLRHDDEPWESPIRDLLLTRSDAAVAAQFSEMGVALIATYLPTWATDGGNE